MATRSKAALAARYLLRRHRTHPGTANPVPPLYPGAREKSTYVTSFLFMALGVGGIFYSLSGNSQLPTRTAVAAQTSIVTRPLERGGMTRSVPVRLEIPAINVSTSLVQLGKNGDGSMETPSDYDVAGWYKYSPTPGEIGPAIITGHVDNYLGPAVFFQLKDLQPGQIVNVTREDARVVTFTVDRVEVFSQSSFPTDKVYGNIDYPGLRLITCGGTYDVLSGQYSHNIVVYASYITNT